MIFDRPDISRKKTRNIHPGEVLFKEFLTPYEISAYKLSKDIGTPQTRISEITHGRRRIAADTALRLAKYFRMTPQFWLGLQNDYDFEDAQITIKRQLNSIQSLDRVGSSLG